MAQTVSATCDTVFLAAEPSHHPASGELFGAEEEFLQNVPSIILGMDSMYLGLDPGDQRMDPAERQSRVSLSNKPEAF